VTRRASRAKAATQRRARVEIQRPRSKVVALVIAWHAPLAYSCSPVDSRRAGHRFRRWRDNGLCDADGENSQESDAGGASERGRSSERAVDAATGRGRGAGVTGERPPFVNRRASGAKPAND
jgi:hypothetical protein